MARSERYMNLVAPIARVSCMRSVAVRQLRLQALFGLQGTACCKFKSM
jgi:hypothetical protein